MRQTLIIVAALLVGAVLGAVSHAGITVDNTYAGVHRNPGDTEAAYVLRVHRGSASLDTQSPEIGAAEMLQLRAAALDSQAEFDTVAGSVFGTWYSQSALTTARKAECRAAVLDLCG